MDYETASKTIGALIDALSERQQLIAKTAGLEEGKLTEDAIVLNNYWYLIEMLISFIETSNELAVLVRDRTAVIQDSIEYRKKLMKAYSNDKTSS